MSRHSRTVPVHPALEGGPSVRPRAGRHHRFRAVAAVALCAVLLLADGVVNAESAAAAPTNAGGGTNRVEMVDPNATGRTKSLFAYLRSVQGTGILFGQQQSTEYGLTFDPLRTDGSNSDVRAAVGDYPAVVGWDASATGYGSTPGGVAPEQSLAQTVRMIQAADRLGTIQTMSAHMDNLVTGGNYGDTSGNVVERILPGGDHHADLNAYLDRTARIAKAAVDGNGNPIPIIFRPFHENAGSWFWWGAAHASASQYAELYRYTVEYLRDVKNVRNLLYAYSPGGGFANDDTAFLKAYPGDDFVDVLGIDSYDGSAGSPQWIDSLVADLGMVARIAQARGKVAALTEFGISGALKPNGLNPDLRWYTKVLKAIRDDPEARKIAYMMTWTNFGPDQFFVPVPANGQTAEHELLPDFRAFYADPATFFASDLNARQVWGQKLQTRRHDAAMHIVSPTWGQRVTTTTSTVRVRISDAKVRQAWFVLDDGRRRPLRFDARSGYYLGTLTVDAAQLDNRIATLRVQADLAGRDKLELSQRIVLGERPVAAPGVVDDFESYVDETDLRSVYSTVGANTVVLSRDPIGSGRQALGLGYDFTLQSYTGLNRAIGADWSALRGLSFWYQPDGTDNKLVLQVVTGGVAYEVYPSLAGTDSATRTIPFSDFRPAPWDTANADRRITTDDLRNVAQFNIFVNHAADGAPTKGTVYLDDIRAE